jgi:hypothetical protein
MKKIVRLLCTKSILIFLLQASPAITNAQVSFTPANIGQLADSLVNGIPPGKYYFIGQAHYNSANIPLEQGLLLTLNRKYGLRYDILEYGHSTAIILNEYLRSGADSLLTFIHTAAPFAFIKTVKKLNDTVPEARKIYFYGIDFEGRNNNSHLKKAIDIILYKTNLPDTTTLYEILSKIKNGTNEKILIHLEELKNYLDRNEIICRNQLRTFYIDLLLVANAQYGFSPRRDNAMYANFIRLYQELIKTETNPLFLSSFGYAHINPANTQSIANRLHTTHDSPVSNGVVLLGIQYYQSSFHQEGKKKWTGNLSFLCNNKALQILATIGADGKPAISLLSQSRLISLSCNPMAKKFDAAILVSNMGSAQYYLWE